MPKRIEDYGVRIGRMPRGPRNKITDVPGVRVGHVTLEDGPYRTGVTVIVPGAGNPFLQKPVAACHVLNGYGKTLGLMQIEELGVLETPVALTGTLNVGLVHDALVSLTLDACRADGVFPASINPVVCECNDGRLSDIAARPVREAHVRAAYAAASEDFLEGDVGAGRGMICHDLKGGIGSASRVLDIGGERFTLGVLALTNHGSLRDLRVDGAPVGARIAERIEAEAVVEQGSCIVVAATDLPVSARQLRRILARAGVGLARAGGYIGHGSGEVMVGFSTANRTPCAGGPAIETRRVLREDCLNDAFRAVAECCEEAVLNSLVCARETVGYTGKRVRSLREFMDLLG